MKAAKKIRLVITTLVYSANASARGCKNQLYILQRQADRLQRLPLQLYSQPQQVYTSSAEQLWLPLQLLWLAKLLLNYSTEEIRQAKEPIISIKERHRATDLLQIFIGIHTTAAGEKYKKTAALYTVAKRPLLPNYHTLRCTNCRPP